MHRKVCQEATSSEPRPVRRIKKITERATRKGGGEARVIIFSAFDEAVMRKQTLFPDRGMGHTTRTPVVSRSNNICLPDALSRAALLIE